MYFYIIISFTCGILLSLFFISKDIKKEYRLKYENDIEQYKDIIEEQQRSIDSLRLQLTDLRSYNAISPEVTD